MGRIVAIVILVVFIIFGAWFYWKYYYTYSDGNRTGLLQKFSHRGNAFKTYEGELVLSSVMANNVTPLASEKFYFSVTDDAVAQQLMNYEGHRVKLHYLEKKGALFWRGDSKYIVDSVSKVQEYP